MNLNTKLNYKNNEFLMFVMDEMANEYEKEGKNLIRMTLGKSELPMHPDIISRMQESMSDFKRSSLVFPAGLPELKKSLSVYYKEKYNLEIKPDNFIISVGTSTIFRNLFQVLLNQGDEVLIPRPYYSLYHFSALLAEAEIKYYDIDINTLRLDMESFKNNFSDKTKVVVINSPGNPLGNILTKEELYQIDEVIDGKAVVINDEIYANMVFEGEFTSVMQLKNTKSLFITTDAFSKGFRMYSRRVGYCIVPDELVIPLTVIQHHTLLTLDPIVQYGAIAALEHKEEVQTLRMIYKERRDYTVKKLGDIDIIRVIPAMGSFYISIDCTEFMRKKGFITSLNLAENIMEEKSVAVVPGSDFGIPSIIRLSYSNTRFMEGIDRLYDYFNNY